MVRARDPVSTSLRLRRRKPLSKEVRIVEMGDMVSVGDAISGDRVELCRLVCDVANARREEEGCVLIRRFGGRVDVVTGVEIEGTPVKDAVRVERFEVERKG